MQNCIVFRNFLWCIHSAFSLYHLISISLMKRLNFSNGRMYNSHLILTLNILWFYVQCWSVYFIDFFKFSFLNHLIFFQCSLPSWHTFRMGWHWLILLYFSSWIINIFDSLSECDQFLLSFWIFASHTDVVYLRSVKNAWNFSMLSQIACWRIAWLISS